MVRKTLLALGLAAAGMAASAAQAATVYIGCPSSSAVGISVTVYLPGGPAYFFYSPGGHSTFPVDPGAVYYIEVTTQDGSTTFVADVSGDSTEDLQVTFDKNQSDPGVLTPGQHFVEKETSERGGTLVISRHVGDVPSDADRAKAAELKKLAEETSQ